MSSGTAAKSPMRFKRPWPMGILIGDTCSPDLWTLYMADIGDYIPTDVDDVVVGQISVTNLEQADDIVLLSTTHAGLQRKLNGLVRWCALNFLQINAVKTMFNLFGNRP